MMLKTQAADDWQLDEIEYPMTVLNSAGEKET